MVRHGAAQRLDALNKSVRSSQVTFLSQLQ